jgi:hypothetical protein
VWSGQVGVLVLAAHLGLAVETGGGADSTSLFRGTVHCSSGLLAGRRRHCWHWPA